MLRRQVVQLVDAMSKSQASRRDVVVIGTSAGGVEALKTIAAELPRDFPAAVLVVLHVWSEGVSVLPRILDRVSELPAVHPADGDPLEYGRIYVAPPDYHLVVEPGTARIVRGPRENRHRPAIDPLFRSAAAVYGERVVGCVLTGTGDDGTAGAWSIKLHGGALIVQDPGDAAHGTMPGSVISNIEVDYVLPLSEIPSKLIDLVQNGYNVSPINPFPANDRTRTEVKIAEVDMNAIEKEDRNGKPSAFACPDCNGALWEVEEGGLLRFRCRVGHAYTADSLAKEQSERLEQALWKALRALEEAAALHRRLARRARGRGNAEIAAMHENLAEEQQESARTVRSVIVNPRAGLEATGTESGE